MVKLISNELKMANSKLLVEQCFKMIKDHERQSDNKHTLLNLITNCTLNLEINDLANLKEVMNAVEEGTKAAILHRRQKNLKFEPNKPQRFII